MTDNIKGTEMKIIKIHKNLVDAFHSEGWEEDVWVRLRCRQGRWEYVSGNRMLMRDTIRHLIREK